MICSSCGKEISNNSTFCTYCGAFVQKNDAQAQSQTQSNQTMTGLEPQQQAYAMPQPQPTPEEAKKRRSKKRRLITLIICAAVIVTIVIPLALIWVFVKPIVTSPYGKVFSAFEKACNNDCCVLSVYQAFDVSAENTPPTIGDTEYAQLVIANNTDTCELAIKIGDITGIYISDTVCYKLHGSNGQWVSYESLFDKRTGMYTTISDALTGDIQAFTSVLNIKTVDLSQQDIVLFNMVSQFCDANTMKDTMHYNSFESEGITYHCFSPDIDKVCEMYLDIIEPLFYDDAEFMMYSGKAESTIQNATGGKLKLQLGIKSNELCCVNIFANTALLDTECVGVHLNVLDSEQASITDIDENTIDTLPEIGMDGDIIEPETEQQSDSQISEKEFHDAMLEAANKLLENTVHTLQSKGITENEYDGLCVSVSLTMTLNGKASQYEGMSYVFMYRDGEFVSTTGDVPQSEYRIPDGYAVCTSGGVTSTPKLTEFGMICNGILAIPVD